MGNSNYPNSGLPNPGNDGRDMKAQFEAVGCEVFFGLDLTGREMQGLARQFHDAITPGAIAVIYYSGHGAQMSGENYLIGVDGAVRDPDLMANRSLAFSELLMRTEKREPSFTLSVLDACRNDPFAAKTLFELKGLSPVIAGTGTMVIYATAPGKVAFDSTRTANSLFTGKFKVNLAPGRDILEIFRATAEETQTVTNGVQTPWLSTNYFKKFCFGGCGGGKPNVNLTEVELERYRTYLPTVKCDSGMPFPFYEDGKWGYMTCDGRVLLAPQFESAWRFSEKRAAVRIGGKFGYIDPEGKWIVEPTYESAFDFKAGLAPVKLGDKWLYIGSTGRELPQRFKVARTFSKGYAAAQLNGKWGYLDQSRKWAIEPQFEGAREFGDNGLAPVRQNGKWGFINKRGEWVIEPRLDDARPFPPKVNGVAAPGVALAPARRGRLWGFVDGTGRFAIEPQYEDARTYTEGLARVKARGKWGYAGVDGRWVIQPAFDTAFEFSNGIAIVSQDSGGRRKWSPINSEGFFVRTVNPKTDGGGTVAARVR